MICPTPYIAFGRPVYRDSQTGRFASRADWLDQRVAQELAEQQRAEAVAPGRGVRHLVYQAAPPARAPRLRTKGEAEWHRRNAVAWGHVEA